MSQPDYAENIVYAQGMIAGLLDVIQFLDEHPFLARGLTTQHLKKKIKRIRNTIHNQQVTAESAALGGE